MGSSVIRLSPSGHILSNMNIHHPCGHTADESLEKKINPTGSQTQVFIWHTEGIFFITLWRFSGLKNTVIALAYEAKTVTVWRTPTLSQWLRWQSPWFVTILVASHSLRCGIERMSVRESALLRQPIVARLWCSVSRCVYICPVAQHHTLLWMRSNQCAGQNKIWSIWLYFFWCDVIGSGRFYRDEIERDDVVGSLVLVWKRASLDKN